MELTVIIIISLIIAFYIFRNTYKGIIVSIIYLFFLEWIFYNLLFFSLALKIVEDVIVISFFLKALSKKNKFTFPNKITIIFFYLLIVLCLLSAVNNPTTFLNTLVGYRRVFMSFILFYSFYKLNISEFEFKKIIRILFVLAIIQVPITVFEYFFWINRGIRDGLGGWDGNTGTFPFSGQQAMSVFIIGTIYFIIYRNEILKKNYLFTSFVIIFLGIVLPLASSGGAVYIGILSFIVIYIIKSLKTIKITSFIIIFFALIVVSYIFIDLTQSLYGGELNYLLDTNSLYEYQMYSVGKGEQQGRIAVLIIVFSMISKDLTSLLFGFGPGNFLIAEFIGLTGKYYNKALGMAARFQLSGLIGEFGIFFTLIIFIMLFNLLYFQIKNFFSQTDIQLKFYLIITSSYTLYFILLNLYISPISTIHLYFIFCLMLAFTLNKINTVSNTMINLINN